MRNAETVRNKSELHIYFHILHVHYLREDYLKRKAISRDYVLPLYILNTDYVIK